VLAIGKVTWLSGGRRLRRDRDRRNKGNGGKTDATGRIGESSRKLEKEKSLEISVLGRMG